MIVPTVDVLQRHMVNSASRIVGIDLSGSEKRPTGWAFLHGKHVRTTVLRSTDDILRETLASKPDLVSIDAPLTLPEGRDCTSDACGCRTCSISRACERELRKRGIGVYWGLIPSMQALTKRGMEIARELNREGITVIESFPGAAQDILRIPRKRKNLAHLYTGLVDFEIAGIAPLPRITHDELDAVTSALVGAFYLAGMYEALGTANEGLLIVPSIARDSHHR